MLICSRRKGHGLNATKGHPEANRFLIHQQYFHSRTAVGNHPLYIALNSRNHVHCQRAETELEETNVALFVYAYFRYSNKSALTSSPTHCSSRPTTYSYTNVHVGYVDFQDVREEN